jgi:hypothetical protein
MENSLNLGSRINTTGSINKIVSNINQTCNALMGALEFTTHSASSYGTKITENVMNSEFVDRVVNNILLLNHHLTDLKKNIHGMELNTNELEELTSNLLETSDKLTNLVSTSLYFSNTFGYIVEKTIKNISKVVERIPITS